MTLGKTIIWIRSALALVVLLAGEAAAVEYYFGQSQLMQDSLGRRSAMTINGYWDFRLDGSNEVQSYALPAAVRVQDQFSLVNRFTLDSSMISPVYELMFEGLDGQSTIYVNEKIIANDAPGSSPLAVNLKQDDFFFNSENELGLHFDSQLDYRRSIPLLVRDRGIPLSGNGAYRPIILRAGKKPFIFALAIVPGEAGMMGTLDLNVRVTLSHDRLDSLALTSIQPLRVQMSIFDSSSALPISIPPQAPLFLSAGDTSAVQMAAAIPGFQYWRPGMPHRYRIVAEILMGSEVVDRASLHFALSRPEQWLAESKQQTKAFKYKAIDWVEDETHLLLSQADRRDAIHRDLRGMVDLGVNTVRIPGGTPGDFFLRCCDSLGLAVLVEIPLTNIPSAHLDNAEIKQKARNALAEMIQACRTHPCIAGWGLGSGYDPGDFRTQAFIRESSEIAHRMDHRPVYAGIRGKNLAAKGLPVDLQIVDIPPEEISRLSDGAWPTSGSYLLRLTSMLDSRLPGERTAQQNQAYYLKMAIREAERKNLHAGILISPWKDWTGEVPHTYWGPRPNSRHFRAGLLDSDGQQRLAYQVVRAAFTKSEMPEILPAERPADDPAIFQIVSIALIILLLFYIRRDKRMSHYFQRVFVYPHGFYMDLIENRQINPFLTSVMGLTSFLTMSTLLASLIYFFRDSSLFDEMLTWLFPKVTAKDRAIGLIWHHEMMIIVLTGIMVGLALLQSFLYKMIVFGQNRYLRFSQIVTFTFWVPANFIFALPLAVVFFRVLSQANLVTASLIYFAAILLWFFFRAWRGTKVILQINLFHALLIMLTGIAIIALSLGLYLEHSRALTAYFSYYWSLMGQ